MSARLTLKGFDSYLLKLRKAGADVQKASEKALLKSAEIFENELVQQVNASPMSKDTKDAMMESFVKPRIVHSTDMLVVAETGFKMGEYNPHPTKENPLSGGFIAQFNEYGTKNRRTRKGESRGSLEEIEFTRRAHKAVDPKIRKTQKKILEGALKEALGDG